MYSCGGTDSTDLEFISEWEDGCLYKAGPVSILRLNGTHYQMGRQYGMLLKDDLQRLYDSMILEFSLIGLMNV